MIILSNYYLKLFTGSLTLPWRTYFFHKSTGRLESGSARMMPFSNIFPMVFDSQEERFIETEECWEDPTVDLSDDSEWTASD